MREYDFDKIESLISSARELDYATAGMSEDWAWTGVDIWKDGKYSDEYKKGDPIAGILGSYWATPTLVLTFKDGTEKRYDVFTGEPTKSQPPFPMGGPISTPATEHVQSIPKSES